MKTASPKQFRFLSLVAAVCAVVFLFSSFAVAEPLKVDLAEDHVNITSGFTGSKLVLFGSKTQKGDVVVVLEGPHRDSVVRRKERVLGAWVNRMSLEFEDMPSYYDYALSVDESETTLLKEDVLKEKLVGLKALQVAPKKARYDEDAVKAFQLAFLRNKQDRNLYPLKAGSVRFIDDTLFRADFEIPSNVPSGEYIVRALLVNNGKVAYEQTRTLKVGLVGFSSGIYEFAHYYSFFYGFLCVFLALVTGWLSDFIVRRS